MLKSSQAELNEYTWMHLSTGLQVYVWTEENSDKHYLLKLEVSIYGLKQASFNWYEKLMKYLEDS